MNQFKTFLAYFGAWVFFSLGVLCMYLYMSTDITLTSLAWGLGAMVVFHPAVDYWITAWKRFLNTEKD